MARVLPDWQPFELETENPTPLELPGRRGPGVVLLVSPSVHESGWGARAAAQIAGLRAARSGRILLGDLAVEDPRLHELLGVDNDVGMSDVFLFGSSIQKTARNAGRGFLFSPAGTATADPARILEHERWTDVLEGFERAGADLFLYVPWSSDGWQSLVTTVGNVVVLAGRHEVAALDIPDGGEVRIGAVLGPPDRNGGGQAVVTAADAPPMDVAEPRAPEEAAGVESLSDEGEEEPVPVADDPALGGGSEVRDGSGEAPYPSGPHARVAATSDADGSSDADDTDGSSGADDVDGSPDVHEAPGEISTAAARESAGGPEARLHDPGLEASGTGGADAGWSDPPREEAPPESSSGRLWLTIVVVLLVVAAAIAVAVALLGGPDDASGSPGEPSAPVSVAEGGETSPPAPSEETGGAEDEASATEGVTATGAPVDADPAEARRPFVVGVASYREAGAAEDARASLAARLEGAAVLRVPVAVDGVVWHRIVAGPASEASGARALRARAAGLLGVDTTSMLVRSAPFAFQLDAGASLEAMQARVEALRTDGVPAYLLESAGPEGAVEYRVYAGAFESPDDASYLRSVLAEVGITEAALVERVGRYPGA